MKAGSSLSRREKQWISIARAILKDSTYNKFLDEATASLDPENEVHVQQALSNLVKNKTIVVIAHRLQSIQDADQILVLDKSRVMWREQNRAKSWKFRK